MMSTVGDDDGVFNFERRLLRQNYQTVEARSQKFIMRFAVMRC